MMEIITCSLTVLFEDPFWIGVYERAEGGRYSVSRIVFGAEPKDYQVYGWYLQNSRHMKFSPSLPDAHLAERPVNPKRAQREIARSVANAGVSTKAQAALQLEREQNKQERRVRRRERSEEERLERYQMRREKHREKHRGH